ncbi:G-patch-domain-containing protein [Piromyces finnis]|uniref:G-patch-domain-containing protein n=1 Tax=Piromyces finnis TaxID=1754191 RepID=A0A1Y1VJB8_9FUNG|nr:G-patch-domain-containing protein [Piromyces finnis]|eukprot:ORX57809.1 G-patch-domain-containing protein [Piromyces finnis]
MDDYDDDYFPNFKQNEQINYNDYERSSMDNPISSSNIGYKLLQKMGWSEGKGLGPELQGRIDPIRIDIKEDFWGLGKDEEMERYNQLVTSKPKTTQMEIIANETEEEKKIREEKVKQEEELKKELKEINSVFYCSLCNKQYSKISEYEIHLDSYDHNHKKRFLEMKKTEQFNNKKRVGEIKRLKEQKRHEKEMQQLAEFANKQQGIIGTTSINQTRNLNDDIKTINTSNSKGGWVNSFSSTNDNEKLDKDINSKGTPGWKNSFTSEQSETTNDNSGWSNSTQRIEPSNGSGSGLKFSFGMKKPENSSLNQSKNKPIGFSIGKKTKAAPIKFKFNK